ncbi:MAG: exodeoxyribonuclease VII small subunit [Gammaproteobacteria bacterium]
MSAGKDSNLSFEQALRELEQITADIEDGSMPLEEVVAAYKRGVKLLGFCRQKLGAAKDAVAQLDGKAAGNDD